MINYLYNPIERDRPAVWVRGPIEPGMTPRLMRYAREAIEGDRLEIVIDSSGGSCAEGIRLHDALAALPVRRRVTVLHAPSMASVIAMVGDDIRIVPNGHVFLHPPGYQRDRIVEIVGACHLTSTDMRRMADQLDATDEHHLDIYQRRTGLPRDRLRSLSAENTLLDAAEAVRLGFADEVVPWPI